MSKIEWTDKTYSPIRARVKDNAHEIAILHGWNDLAEIVLKMAGHVGPHCEMCSPGCNHCYSLTNNGRCLPNNGTGLPFDKRSRELVDIFVDEKILMQPLHWKAPKKIFVENQSDLFGEWVPFEMVDKVFAVMALCPQHTFQVLTKRPERMLRFMDGLTVGAMESASKTLNIKESDPWDMHDALRFRPFPLPNVWLGVSAEDQKRADERTEHLRNTPAVVRFISYEPALEYVKFDLRGIDWLIAGGESGTGARPFDIQWVRDVKAQCGGAGTAFFMKQAGAVPIMPGRRQNHWDWGGAWGHTPKFSNHSESPAMWRVHLKSKKGGDMEEWPGDLRVREFPK